MLHSSSNMRARSSNGYPTLLVRCLALLCLAFTPLPAADKPVTVEGSLEAVIPSDLRSLLIENPYVLFKVDVGEDGTLFDVMAVESNHRDLIPSAMKTLLAAKFFPSIENGKPTRSRTSVFVRFFDPEQRAWKMGSGQIPFGGTVSDAVRRKIYATSEQRFVFGESDPDEIDTPIKSLKSTRRIYADARSLGISAKGRCLVEFYVSPEGRARFPSALESDSDEVSISAALTLLETYYAPPRREGNPTFIKVQQEFIFR
jgi:hypothetical protein